jgi:pimeloyl-ACP methyl ester carboxylesterase
MPFFQANDHTSLFYTDWGAGKPVLFVHSWALSSDMWAYQMPHFLAAGFRCVAYDKRGHGRSDRPRSGYHYDSFAEDLDGLIEQLDLSHITVVAHSAGSGDAVRYMARHGADRVERVILLAPTTPLLVRTEDNLDGLEPDALAASAGALMRDVPRWCEENAPAFFGTSEVSPGLADWVIRQIVDTPLKILLDTAAAFTTTDFRAELASLAVPTLVVHGDLDASAPIELTGRKTAALIANSQLLVYEGSGHGLYAADHERLNSDMLAFIEQRQALAVCRSWSPSAAHDDACLWAQVSGTCWVMQWMLPPPRRISRARTPTISRSGNKLASSAAAAASKRSSSSGNTMRLVPA